jgi:hypothetical protein
MNKNEQENMAIIGYQLKDVEEETKHMAVIRNL